MLTNLQKKTSMAVVNVFETAQVLGDYGKVTLLPGYPGHLTYGRSQTTLASGNLFLLIKAYNESPDAALAGELAPYLDRLADQDLSLDHDTAFRGLLRQAGEDPVMQGAQDDFFDRVYWAPALRSSEFIGVESALGTTVVYDSRIHGSWHRMRDRTSERHGAPADLGETAWISRYIEVRRDWLANHSIPILRRTVYRMDAFQRLIESDNWALDLPIEVRGWTIDESVLTGGAAVRASAEVAEIRLLRLRRPFMQGSDVRELQEKLAGLSFELDVDGVFGPGTEHAVKAYQKRNGLVADGIVGAATRSALAL